VTLPELKAVRSVLMAPLQAGDQVVGILNLMHGQANFFDQEAVDHIAAFASQAALAIQNAHLYQEVESALAQEQYVRKQLIQSEKFAAMGRLVGSVAHELNNPLQTIQNCLYLTRQDTPVDSPVQEYLDMAFSETNRLSNLVAQLRELYRPHISNAAEPRSLLKILDEVHGLLSAQLQNHNVVWNQIPELEDTIVNCVSDQIKQVFINICSNAIEAMQPDGGTLSVALLRSDDASQVGVGFQDTGPGIPPEVLNNIFEPFSTTKPSGLGLGLAISYELVQRHHGTISVESVTNQGAAFTVWLPLTSAGHQNEIG